MKFNIGDVVRLKQGVKPLLVVKAREREIACRYKSGYGTGAGSRRLIFRNINSFVFYEGTYSFKGTQVYHELNLTLKKETNMTKQIKKGTLFQVKDKDKYGVFLTKDSKNQFVLEMKPSGDIRAFDEKDLSEVLPYTVDVRFNGTAKIYSYNASEGQVEVGDLLMIEGASNIACVVKVNSKSLTATADLKGRIIETKKIK